MKLKIKKGDKVKIIAGIGAKQGQEGVVLEIDKKNLQVKVQGVRVMTHFDKKDGIQKKEGFIDYSNVKLLEKAQAKKASGKKTAASKKA